MDFSLATFSIFILQQTGYEKQQRRSEDAVFVNIVVAKPTFFYVLVRIHFHQLIYHPMIYYLTECCPFLDLAIPYPVMTNCEFFYSSALDEVLSPLHKLIAVYA
jgi:hypothetical protein